jgi:hypothetical protein
MNIGRKLVPCVVCGCLLIAGAQAHHECKGIGWCSPPVTEPLHTPHAEHTNMLTSAAEQMVMPPSRGLDWMPNNQMTDLRRRGHPAWSDDNYANARWLQAATQKR